mmetsp:Transcript_2251/g.4734  ORF Transcript_2251/g.4734 Transcript_2251/m.4734 type:complete len:92 (-) Transcript_2251:2403-2678(-)
MSVPPRQPGSNIPSTPTSPLITWWRAFRTTHGLKNSQKRALPDPCEPLKAGAEQETEKWGTKRCEHLLHFVVKSSKEHGVHPAATSFSEST